MRRRSGRARRRWSRPSCAPSRTPSRASAPASASLRLAKTYGEVRLEAACQRGLTIGARTYGSIVSILKTGLDRAFHDETAPDAAPLQMPVAHWHEVIGDPTIADAVLDRLVHNAHRLLMKGESLRKRAAKALLLDADAVA